MENVCALISRTKGKYNPVLPSTLEEWIDGPLNILQDLFVYLTEDQGKPFHFYIVSRRNELVVVVVFIIVVLLNFIFPHITINIHGMEQPENIT